MRFKLFLVFSLIFNVSLFCQDSLKVQSKLKLDVLGVRNIESGNFYGVSLSLAVTPNYRENIYGFLIGGFVATGAKKVNGITIGAIYTLVEKQNGVAFSPFIGKFDKFNGVSFSNGGFYKEMNGVNFSFLGSHCEQLKGVSIVGLINGAEKVNGVQVGLFNAATSGKLFQIGLFNHIRENPKWCRTLPFLNFRISKS